MKAQTLLALFAIVGFTQATLQASPIQKMDMGDIKDDNHLLMCEFKAKAAYYTCAIGASLKNKSDKVAQDKAMAECARVRDEAMEACKGPADKKEGEAENHLTVCEFKAKAAYYTCSASAYFKNRSDSAAKEKAIAECADARDTAMNACAGNPVPMEDKPAEKPAEQAKRKLMGGKHRSWCTFKCWSRRSWCYIKASGTFNSAKRSDNYKKCRDDYNMGVAACAQNRLLKQMEQSFKNGTAHEGWCEFKSSFKWLGCKIRAFGNTSKAKRDAAFAACDATLNARKAECAAEKAAKEEAKAAAEKVNDAEPAPEAKAAPAPSK